MVRKPRAGSPCALPLRRGQGTQRSRADSTTRTGTGSHLGHKLVGDRFVILKADLPGGERALQEEPQRQLRQLRFDQRADRLVSEGENLLAFLLPLVILKPKKVVELPYVQDELAHTHLFHVKLLQDSPRATRVSSRVPAVIFLLWLIYEAQQ